WGVWLGAATPGIWWALAPRARMTQPAEPSVVRSAIAGRLVRSCSVLKLRATGPTSPAARGAALPPPSETPPTRFGSLFYRVGRFCPQQRPALRQGRCCGDLEQLSRQQRCGR